MPVSSKHLARHRLLEALARLDEAGQRRMHARRPDALAAQETALAVMDQHDHRRIGAREMRRRCRRGWCSAAHGRLPRSASARRRRRRSGGARANRRCRAHRPRSAPSSRGSSGPTRRRSVNATGASARIACERRFDRREIDREIGALPAQAQQHRSRRVGAATARRAAANARGAAPLAAQHQVLAAPDRHEAACGIVEARGQPGRVLAPMRGAVEAAGIEIGFAAFFQVFDLELPTALRRCWGALI